MSYQQIASHKTGETLFAGHFETLRACAEQAVRENIALDFADFSKANLVNANLDEGSFRHAVFSGANLMGANLSDTRADFADFCNAGLQNACLALSSLSHCDFTGALFGATDIYNCDFSGSAFSTISALDLNFADARAINDCRFIDELRGACGFSRTPVVLRGLAYPVALFDTHIKIGALLSAFDDLLAYTNDNLPPVRLDDGLLHVFVHKHKDCLSALIRAFRPEGLMTRPHTERLSA